MGLIFLRTAIIFIALLAVMRLMGKRQIGEMQPFEFVITLLIAELACIPMADISIPASVRHRLHRDHLLFTPTPALVRLEVETL